MKSGIEKRFMSCTGYFRLFFVHWQMTVYNDFRVVLGGRWKCT